MNVLIVNPWVYDFSAYDLWIKPIGLLYISGMLKKAGYNVRVVDCLDRYYEGLPAPAVKKYGKGPYYEEEVEKPPLLKDIPRKYRRFGIPEKLFMESIAGMPKPDLILAGSQFTYWYEGVFEAIALLKKEFNNVPVIMGGIYATLCYEHSKKSGADYVFRGGNLEEILKTVNSFTGKDFSYKGYEADYSFYRKLDYVPVMTSSGCPFRCTYCASNLLNNEFIQRPYEEVIKELEKYHDAGIKNIAFYDDALLSNATVHINKILEGVLERGMSFNFHTPNGLHTRYMAGDGGQEIADLMFKTNFKTIRLSLETVNAERQEQTGAKVRNDEPEKALEHLEKAGFRRGDIEVYVMNGVPGESFEGLVSTVEFISGLGAKTRLADYSPIPGTVDWKDTGLDAACDPLMHNKTAFTLRQLGAAKAQEIKDLVRERNGEKGIERVGSR